jgi:hypothetical protein
MLEIIHLGDGTIDDLAKAKCPDPECGGTCIVMYELYLDGSVNWLGEWLCDSCCHHFSVDGRAINK